MKLLQVRFPEVYPVLIPFQEGDFPEEHKSEAGQVKVNLPWSAAIPG